jgi:hypothetical protein
VPDVPKGTYFVETDPDGSQWLFCRRRSAADANGRSGLLREPELSWAIPLVAKRLASHLSLRGVRIEDTSAACVYEAELAVLDQLGEPHSHPKYEPQWRLALVHWTRRPTDGRPGPHQLQLFSQRDTMTNAFAQAAP